MQPAEHIYYGDRSADTDYFPYHVVVKGTDRLTTRARCVWLCDNIGYRGQSWIYPTMHVYRFTCSEHAVLFALHWS